MLKNQGNFTFHYSDPLEWDEFYDTVKTKYAHAANGKRYSFSEVRMPYGLLLSRLRGQ